MIPLNDILRWLVENPGFTSVGLLLAGMGLSFFSYCCGYDTGHNDGYWLGRDKQAAVDQTPHPITLAADLEKHL